MTSTGPALQVPLDGAAAILHPAVFAARGLEAVFELDGVALALRVFAAVDGRRARDRPDAGSLNQGFGIASHCAREYPVIASHNGLAVRALLGTCHCQNAARAPHNAVASRDSLSLRATSSLLRRSMSSSRPGDAQRGSVALALHDAATMQ